MNQVILNQLGGNKFVAMTGVRDILTTETSLQFKLPRLTRNKINHVKITLNANDLYDVTFGRVSNKKDKAFGVMMPHYDEILKVDDVEVSNLRSVFELKTGLYTSL